MTINTKQCNICINESIKWIIPKCGHEICFDCYIKIIKQCKKRCPMCRQEYDDLAFNIEKIHKYIIILKENYNKQIKNNKYSPKNSICHTYIDNINNQIQYYENELNKLTNTPGILRIY
jgi:hypothetical protein